MQYKVGDRVRIVSSRAASNWAPNMDKWLGQVMTIRGISAGYHYRMEEDIDEHGGIGWAWDPNMIAGLEEEFTEADFEPATEAELMTLLSI